MKPKEYIDDIKSKQLTSDKEFVLDSLAGAIDRLQKAFPRYGSFLMEFVQNADDAKSKSLRIEVLTDTVRIFNDGKPFSENDVKSICKVGRSSKTAEDYIGYLGVGFKAVFLISNCPCIYSGDFNFKFEKAKWDDPAHTPWQVIPLWVDEPLIELTDKYTTAFNLPLKESGLVVKLGEEVKPEHLSDRILLFLRNIIHMEIADSNQNLKRKVTKSILSSTPDYEVYRTQEHVNDALVREDKWLICRSRCKVPQDVKDDYVTKEWERGIVKEREVLVAFRLGDDDNLLIEERGTAHIGVFSFLPLKEIPSGLNFLIQADFLTAPGRGELARECLWNNWLAKEIYNLITNICIPTFLKNAKWRMNFTEVLYSTGGGHELFEHIKDPLRAYIENNPVLIAEDGSVAKADELVRIEQEIRGLITDDDLYFLYPGKRIIHNDCKPGGYSFSVDKMPSDIYYFIDSSVGEKLVQRKAELVDIGWFKKLFSMFVDKYTYSYFMNSYPRYNVEHDNFWDKMRDFNNQIVLTEDSSLAKINECYTNPNNLIIPAHVRSKVKIVHPELVKDEDFKKFIKQLNEIRYHRSKPDNKVLRELEEDDIRKALKEKEAVELTPEKWEKLPSLDKIEKIKHLKNLWNTPYLSLADYSYLTLPSKTGKWLKPQSLVFPQEYKPEHCIETLIGKGLLDQPLEFLDPVFTEYCSDDEIRLWRRYFSEMGVDKSVDGTRDEKGKKGGMVHRIGILTALRYEKNCGRPARALDESEQKGYDIEVKSADEERFIEVKGTSNTSYDVVLTVNEFKALRSKQDKYYIYFVMDALRNPILCVTQGDKLLQIEDVKLMIPFNKWRNVIDGEFQP